MTGAGADLRPIVVVLNMQNEIVHPDGQIGALGNAARVEQRGVLTKTASVLAAARAAGHAIFFVGNGYDENYTGLNRSVALFADHERHRSMQIGSWSTRFHDAITPVPGDQIVYHAGLGSFANSAIATLLPPAASTHVYLAGVSTRLVVEAATFEFTDRGYPVTVIEDCCAAATAEAHAEALTTLARFASISGSAEVIDALRAAV